MMASRYGPSANAAASARTNGFMKKVLSCGVTFTRTQASFATHRIFL
jgi:hypothetical protein